MPVHDVGVGDDGSSLVALIMAFVVTLFVVSLLAAVSESAGALGVFAFLIIILIAFSALSGDEESVLLVLFAFLMLSAISVGMLSEEGEEYEEVGVGLLALLMLVAYVAGTQGAGVKVAKKLFPIYVTFILIGYTAGGLTGAIYAVAFMLFLSMLLFHFVLRPVFLRIPVSGPIESLIGLKGEAVTDLTPYGKVKMGDTFWRAEAKGGHIRKGETVETVNVDEKKLILKVLKTENE